MPCACANKNKKFEVVDKAGKVVFSNASKPTCDAVAKRYPDSTVREKPKDGTESKAAPTAAG